MEVVEEHTKHILVEVVEEHPELILVVVVEEHTGAHTSGGG